MKINLRDIQSEEIRNNIEACTKEIQKFIYMLRVLLLPNCNIDVDQLSMWIIEKDESVFLDDGNTRCPGKNYKVTWAIDLNGKAINQDHFDAEMVKNCLTFSFEQSERLMDHKARHLRFFSMYLYGNGLNKDPYDCVLRDHNNDNYSLTSIINSENLARAAIEVKRITEENQIIASASAMWKAMAYR